MSAADVDRWWVIQPLLDAGVTTDDVETLLFRVTFECLVGGGSNLSDVSAFLGEQPRHVRAAWIETINRMIGTSTFAPAI